MWLVFNLASVLLWSVVNILDSLLVRHYTKRPIVLSWVQSCFSVLLLGALAIVHPPHATAWIVVFLLGGIAGYLGDLLFWVSLDRIDVSVINLAWAFHALFLSLIGFAAFGEHWTLLQGVGALCVLCSVMFLSVRDRSILRWSSLFLLVGIAALYTPFYAVQKAGLAGGADFFAVLFWPVFGREVSAFLFPWLLPSARRDIRAAARGDACFFTLNGIVIALFFGGLYCSTRAFQVGTLSLVSIVSNAQPFFVLGLAWLCSAAFPRFAPRELLGARALWVKISAFAGVFVGLALLALYP